MTIWSRRWVALTAAASAGPLITLPADLSPPWPPDGAVAIATLLCAFAILLANARVQEVGGSAKRNENMLHEGRATVLLGVVLLLAYFALYSGLVIPQVLPNTRDTLRFVIGFVRQPQCVSGTAIGLLQDHQYDASQCWTPLSLAAARWSLMAIFDASFFALTYGFALLSQKERRSE